MLILCNIALWLLLRLVSCLALPKLNWCAELIILFSCIISVLLALWSPLFGKKELVYVLLVYLFVYFARGKFCLFLFSLCVWGWLRLVIVAHPGHFVFFLSDSHP